MRRDLPVAICIAFIGGYATSIQVQDYQEQERVKQTAEAIRKCNGKGWEYVFRPSGYDCVALQPRFEMIVPYQGDPLKLRRREIKQAIHSEPKEKS